MSLTIKAAKDLEVGDIVHGTEGSSWGSTWEIVRSIGSTRRSIFGSTYRNFSVRRFPNGDVIPWDVMENIRLSVEVTKTYKYDPTQAGDTEDDI